MKNGYATLEECQKLKTFFEIAAMDAKPLPDGGTCVMGNGISVSALLPRKRNPTRVMVFRNGWTQGEQPDAIRKMIEQAKEKFPELASVIHYECGIMD